MRTTFAPILGKTQYQFLSLFKESQTLTREEILDRMPEMSRMKKLGHFFRVLEISGVVECARPSGGLQGSRIESISLTKLGGEQIGVKVKLPRVKHQRRNEIPCGWKTSVCYHAERCCAAMRCSVIQKAA